MQKGLHLTAQGVVPPSVRTGVHSLLQQYYYHITNILSSLLPHGFEYQWRLDSGPTHLPAKICFVATTTTTLSLDSIL